MNCDLCGLNESDTPDHTVRLWPKFDDLRQNSILNTSKCLKEIIDGMLGDERTWQHTQFRLKKLMERKRSLKEERSRQPAP